MIRTLRKADLPEIIRRYCFPWSTPEKTKILWEKYYEEQQLGNRIIAIIEKNREILGYGSLLRKSEYLEFANSNTPEINNVWVDEHYRGQGLGTALIKSIENLAIQEGYRKVGIGVGLYRDYGSAQRLYFRLGYIPDGNGVTYNRQAVTPGLSYPVDDELILWLVKVFTTEKDSWKFAL